MLIHPTTALVSLAGKSSNRKLTVDQSRLPPFAANSLFHPSIISPSVHPSFPCYSRRTVSFPGPIRDAFLRSPLRLLAYVRQPNLLSSALQHAAGKIQPNKSEPPTATVSFLWRNLSRREGKARCKSRSKRAHNIWTAAPIEAPSARLVCRLWSAAQRRRSAQRTIVWNAV